MQLYFMDRLLDNLRQYSFLINGQVAVSLTQFMPVLCDSTLSVITCHIAATLAPASLSFDPLPTLPQLLPLLLTQVEGVEPLEDASPEPLLHGLPGAPLHHLPLLHQLPQCDAPSVLATTVVHNELKNHLREEKE